MTLKGCSEMGLFRHFKTTSVTSVTSEIQWLWGSSFPSKCLKCDVDFTDGAKNSEKGFSQIIAFELVAAKSVYYKENTCHRHSMC